MMLYKPFGGERLRRCLCLLCALCALPWAFPLGALCSRDAPQGRWVLIELDLKRLTLYDGADVLKTYPIASGKADTPSPVGVYRVSSRFRTQMSGFGTSFLGLNVPFGQYGIHGTNAPHSIGRNASHGCIRMRVRDAEELYAMVHNGARVVIENGAYGALGGGLRTLISGARGSDVQLVQQRLIAQGFLSGRADGVLGENTVRAVLAARKAHGLSASPVVDGALYQKLGLMRFE